MKALKQVVMTKRIMLNAIQGSGGLIGEIAKRIPCSRQTVRLWIDAHEDLKEIYEDEVIRVSDLAEKVVIRNIELASEFQDAESKQADSRDARWYLERKHSGYKGEALISITNNILEIDGNVDDIFEQLSAAAKEIMAPPIREDVIDGNFSRSSEAENDA